MWKGTQKQFDSGGEIQIWKYLVFWLLFQFLCHMPKKWIFSQYCLTFFTLFILLSIFKNFGTFWLFQKQKPFKFEFQHCYQIEPSLSLTQARLKLKIGGLVHLHVWFLSNWLKSFICRYKKNLEKYAFSQIKKTLCFFWFIKSTKIVVKQICHKINHNLKLGQAFIELPILILSPKLSWCKTFFLDTWLLHNLS